jgi:hypothetical protein
VISQPLPAFPYAVNPFGLVNPTAYNHHSGGEFPFAPTSFNYQQMNNRGHAQQVERFSISSPPIWGNFSDVISPSGYAFSTSNQDTIPHNLPAQHHFQYPLFSYYDPGSSFIYHPPSVSRPLEYRAAVSSVSEGEHSDGQFSDTMDGSLSKRRKSNSLLSSDMQVTDVDTILQRENKFKMTVTSNRVSEIDGLDVLVSRAGSLEEEDIT